jgi:hypothetical protein
MSLIKLLLSWGTSSRASGGTQFFIGIRLRMLVAMSIGCQSTMLAFILGGHILLAPSGLFSIPPRVSFCSVIWLEGKQN